jgi:hypothetical protein
METGYIPLIYKPEKYEDAIAIDIKPSEELKEYHKNSVIQINMNDKIYHKKVTE